MTAKMFRMPSTPKCRVFWKRDGVDYVSIMNTPTSNDALQVAMLAKHVSMREVTGVAALRPQRIHAPRGGWRN